MTDTRRTGKEFDGVKFQRWLRNVGKHLGYQMARSWMEDAEVHFLSGMSSRNFAQRVTDTYTRSLVTPEVR
jgi:hypothetical protein